MLELGPGADILRAFGWLYIGLIVVLVAASLWFPKRWWQKLVGAAAVLLVFTGPAYLRNRERSNIADERKARYEKAKALFDERCRTAGEKIYRTVENVRAILLINPRPDRSNADRANRDWLGAGFPGESGGSQYIMEFLYYNKPPSGNRGRGLGWIPGGVRGYRYVDVEEQGKRFRYALRDASEYSGGSDPVRGYGSREIALGEPPRYTVAYESINDPEGRASWVAGGSVKIIDQRTGELLGEFIRYAFEAGFGSTHGERSPWAFATQCPMTSYGGSSGHIRSFVEQVLKPKQGE